MDPAKEQQHPAAGARDPPQTLEPMPSVSSEMSDMVGLLAKSVQGMQGSLGNAYQVSSRIEHDESTDMPLLVLTVENKSQFPIPGVTGTIRIGNDDNVERIFVPAADTHAKVLSSIITTTKKGKRDVKPTNVAMYSQPDAQEEADKIRAQSSEDFMPGTKRTDTFLLNLGNFDTWIVMLEVTFPSPGTGRKLSKKHECCVYLIDQCAVKWISDDESKAPTPQYAVSMSTAAVRQILKVPVTEGVAVGKMMSLTSSKGDFRIHGCVSSILENGQKSELMLWSDDSSEDMQRILRRIHIELNVLGELPQRHAMGE
ncbi:hypothetical protein EDD11_002104 [Mortierella claussenii]|nr:hypothetical protein EDD11_002104 [Mortierella claussenii]